MAFVTNAQARLFHYSDTDFAAIKVGGVELMLHADHTYDKHPWHQRLVADERRGLGAELCAFSAWTPMRLRHARGALARPSSSPRPQGAMAGPRSWSKMWTATSGRSAARGEALSRRGRRGEGDGVPLSDDMLTAEVIVDL